MIRAGFLQKPGLTIVLAFCFLNVFGQEDEGMLRDVAAHRRKQEAVFRDPAQSPLDARDRRKFKGLAYYKADDKYRVKARFLKNEDRVTFLMETTTDRRPEYVKYGEVRFTLDGRSYALEVYQSPEIIKRPGYHDYLFIPFTDLTNGQTTYEGGRYLEMRIPESEEVIVDFNLAYNPYCAYSPGFSCPIPPQVNHLEAAIHAGEKKFRVRKH